MVHAKEKSPMFALSKTQIRIVSRMLDIEKRLESKQIGVTKYDLEHNVKRNAKPKETEYVSRRTFRDNEKKLTESYCIKIVSEEQQKKQTVGFYQVTPIGFFHFIESEKITNIDTKHMEHFKKFFPKIGIHWNDHCLLSAYDRKLLLIVLKYSLNSVEIEQSESTWRSRDENTQNHFRFTMNVPIIEDVSELHLKKYFLTIAHKTKYNKEITKKYNRNSIQFQFSEDISFFIDEFAALFYLNLLRLHYDYTFRNRIYSVFTDEPQRNDYDILEMAKYDENNKKFSDKIDSSTKKLFEMINKDKKIQKVMTSFIADINDSLSMPEYLEEIHSEIT
ncbi:hypothetical protein [Nitrosopumilus sp.]|uniref:hypothetical protein n=1 Tax=Nitrosopumilus sp. TaxID=2024843 RepID=UPI00247C5CCF|nr:hypothetical protein [Nitrosopumilus sp.]MCV0410099.1 hypothetical protein [Nitrosopumilus sp.]